MRHIKLPLLAICLLIGPTASAFELVSQQEYENEVAMVDAIPRDLAEKEDPLGPRIRVVRPEGNAVKSPFDINVVFIPSAGSSIDVNSIKITYGDYWKMDVTDRVLEKAKVTEKGIQANSAEAPEGDHVFTIKVADTQKRTGMAKIRVKVM